MSSTSLRLRFCKNLRRRWCLICLFVNNLDSLVRFRRNHIVGSLSSSLILSKPRTEMSFDSFLSSSMFSSRLVHAITMKVGFLKLFVPVNLIPSIIIDNFVAMMRFDSVYLRSMGEVVVLAAMKGLWRRWWTEAHGFACRIWWLNSPNCHRPSSIVQLQRSLLYSV